MDLTLEEASARVKLDVPEMSRALASYCKWLSTFTPKAAAQTHLSVPNSAHETSPQKRSSLS